MIFASTRDPRTTVSFREAVFRGLAPDGGLYHPTTEPDLSGLFDSLPADVSFVDVAAKMVAALIPELGDPDRLARRAFSFSPALKKLDDDVELLELFHGPSSAFKDFGACFLAAVMEELLEHDRRHAVILTATSGDTGSAVAQAFHDKRNVDVVVLYPSGRVSPLQEKQLTTLGGNITALEVAGSFDDCQRMVKEAFVDRELCDRMTLSSANSINLGRLLPQSFYYVWAWARLRGRRPVRPLWFCVPSGNFGNLTSGVLARRWGLAVDGFIAATNRNDVVPEYLRTSRFRPRASVATYSNAMDVGNPSNFERLLAIFGGSWDAMRSAISEEVVTDEETAETIREVYAQSSILLDPHTAVGLLAARRFLARRQGRREVSAAMDGEARTRRQGRREVSAAMDGEATGMSQEVRVQGGTGAPEARTRRQGRREVSAAMDGPATGMSQGARVQGGTGAPEARPLVVTLATAHPAKFVEIVEPATGARPELPPNLARLLDLPKRSIMIANETSALKQYLLGRF